ncbi:MAG: transposase [Dysgonamonadaceae bacterium]|nr:transposase [Dysgonamonadaceae bacterium]
MRRFALHILPSGFVRIRHYGILSATSKNEPFHLSMNRLAQ